MAGNEPSRISQHIYCPLCKQYLVSTQIWHQHLERFRHQRLYLVQFSKLGPEQFEQTYGNVPFGDKQAYVSSVAATKVCQTEQLEVEEWKRHCRSPMHHKLTAAKLKMFGSKDAYNAEYGDVPASCHQFLQGRKAFPICQWYTIQKPTKKKKAAKAASAQLPLGARPQVVITQRDKPVKPVVRTTLPPPIPPRNEEEYKYPSPAAWNQYNYDPGQTEPQQASSSYSWPVSAAPLPTSFNSQPDAVHPSLPASSGPLPSAGAAVTAAEPTSVEHNPPISADMAQVMTTNQFIIDQMQKQMLDMMQTINEMSKIRKKPDDSDSDSSTSHSRRSRRMKPSSRRRNRSRSRERRRSRSPRRSRDRSRSPFSERIVFSHRRQTGRLEYRSISPEDGHPRALYGASGERDWRISPGSGHHSIQNIGMETRYPGHDLVEQNRQPPEMRQDIATLHVPESPEAGYFSRSSRPRHVSPSGRHISVEVRPTSPRPRHRSPELRLVDPRLGPMSPGLRDTSPGMEHISPGPRHGSPGLGYRSPSPRYVSSEQRYMSPGPSYESTELGHPDRSPRPRHFIPEQRSISPASRYSSQIERYISLSPEPRHRSPGLRHPSPEPRHRSPGLRHQSLGSRHRSPGLRYQGPGLRDRSPGIRHQSPGPRHRSPGSRHKSSESRYRSPGSRHRSPGSSHRSPELRHRSPKPRHMSPEPRHQHPRSRHRSPELRHRSPTSRHIRPRSRHRSPGSRHRSPRSRHRSPGSRHQRPRSRHRSPGLRHRSPSSRHLSPRSRHRSPRSRHRSPGSRHRSPGPRHRSHKPRHESMNQDQSLRYARHTHRSPRRPDREQRRSTERRHRSSSRSHYRSRSLSPGSFSHSTSWISSGSWSRSFSRSPSRSGYSGYPGVEYEYASRDIYPTDHYYPAVWDSSSLTSLTDSDLLSTSLETLDSDVNASKQKLRAPSRANEHRSNPREEREKTSRKSGQIRPETESKMDSATNKQFTPVKQATVKTELEYTAISPEIDCFVDDDIKGESDKITPKKEPVHALGGKSRGILKRPRESQSAERPNEEPPCDLGVKKTKCHSAEQRLEIKPRYNPEVQPVHDYRQENLLSGSKTLKELQESRPLQSQRTPTAGSSQSRPVFRSEAPVDQDMKRRLQALEQMTGINDQAGIQKILKALQDSDTSFLRKLTAMSPADARDMFKEAQNAKSQASAAPEPPWVALLRSQGIIR